MNRSSHARQSALEMWEPILAIEAESMLAAQHVPPANWPFQTRAATKKKKAPQRRNAKKASRQEELEPQQGVAFASSAPPQNHMLNVDAKSFVLPQKLNANAKAFEPTVCKEETASGRGVSSGLVPPAGNTAADLSSGRLELHCAQLAWHFMKHKTSLGPLPPTGNSSADLSRGSNEMDCAQLAWQFMKHKALRRPLPLPVDSSAAHLSRGSNEMDCAQLAWQFMKHKAPEQRAQPTQHGCAPTECAQLAWEFMRPHARAQASPIIHTQRGVSGMPAVDLTSTAEDDASSQPTRLGTPFVDATLPQPGMPRMKLA